MFSTGILCLTKAKMERENVFDVLVETELSQFTNLKPDTAGAKLDR